MFDLEVLLGQFETKMKENLSAQIELINTEKGDELLTDVQDRAWYFESLDDANHNDNKFIFYNVDSMRMIVNGPSVAREISIDLVMFFSSPNDPKIQTKVLRYWRAIQDAMAQTWDTIGVGYDRAEIDVITPIDVKEVNSSQYHKVFGATINFTIA